MSKPSKTLVSKMSPDAQERAKARTKAMLLELNLQELRQHCTDLTQEEVAELLDVTQAFVSKFERREDVLLSSLYAYIHALGGELELRVRLPGHEDVRVTQFDELGRVHVAAAEVARHREEAAGRGR